MQITESLFIAYSQCPYKAFLKSKGEIGEVVDYEVIQTEADARFRDEAIERLLQSHAESQVTREPASLRLAVKEGVKLDRRCNGRSPRNGSQVRSSRTACRS